MQERVVDALLEYLKENSFDAHVDFPDTEVGDSVVIVTPILIKDSPKSGILSEKISGDTAILSRIVDSALVTVQIDAFAKTSRARDKLVDELRKVLKRFPDPTPERPVVFLRIREVRTVDTPEWYRSVFMVEFLAFEILDEEAYIVRQTVTETLKEV